MERLQLRLGTARGDVVNPQRPSSALLSCELQSPPAGSIRKHLGLREAAAYYNSITCVLQLRLR